MKTNSPWWRKLSKTSIVWCRKTLSCKYLLDFGTNSTALFHVLSTTNTHNFYYFRCAFDIIPVDSNFRNKSPVLHSQNCLGLESWSVKHVYIYCYNELMDKYFSKSKRKSSKPNFVNSEKLTKMLNVTLLINPELSTLWNKRREMVEFHLLEKTFELQFTKIALSRKPKCNDIFSYRRWLLQDTLPGNLFKISCAPWLRTSCSYGNV